MKPTIITIAGTLGSGKSSTAKCLAKKLGYLHFSSGDLFRAMAAERGLTVEEINERAELEQEIDYAVDARIRELGAEKNLVVDSRLAFHWIPQSFKVFLDLNPQIAAKRIHDHIKTEGRESQAGETVEEIYANTLARRASEVKRYQNLYNIDPSDPTHYDLVVDTEKNDLDAVVEIVLAEYRKWLDA